jgi:hypothetical protein
VIEPLEKADVLWNCVVDRHSEFAFENFSSNLVLRQMIDAIITFINSFCKIAFRHIRSFHNCTFHQYDVCKYMND